MLYAIAYVLISYFTYMIFAGVTRIEDREDNDTLGATIAVLAIFWPLFWAAFIVYSLTKHICGGK